MFIMDMPPESPREVPVLMAQADNGKRGEVGMRDLIPVTPEAQKPKVQADEDKTVRDRIFGLCKAVPASLAYQGIPFSLGPLGNARQYFELYESQKVDISPATQVSVVTPPQHGKFVVRTAMSVAGYAGYDYLPERGYLGKDSLTLKIELGEKSVLLKYFFNIQNVGDDAADSLCNETGRRWKISYVPDEAIMTSYIVDYQFSSWLEQSSGASLAM